MQRALSYPISAVLWLVGVGFLMPCCVLYLFLSLFCSPRTLNPLVRVVARGVLFAAGQRLQVHGPFPAPREGPYIYMFNHCSLLDTFVLIGAIPEFVGAVGKAEQFDVPIWGQVLRRWGAVPVQRDSLESAIESLHTAAEVHSSGLSLLISPEGTRSPDGRLGPFKKGPFHLAMAGQSTIVPLIISGAYASKNKGSWLLRPGRISIRLAPAGVVRVADFDSVEALRDEARSRFSSLG
jgi:1-acyl-sn-glycerol-3-phosphate acyltransferase